MLHVLRYKKAHQIQHSLEFGVCHRISLIHHRELTPANLLEYFFVFGYLASSDTSSAETFPESAGDFKLLGFVFLDFISFNLM